MIRPLFPWALVGLGFGLTKVLLGCGSGSATPVDPPLIQVRTAPIDAFPGAEGWGAAALNDSRHRPLTVHQVTSTESAGAGSLSWALAQTSGEAFDVILFRTGGVFEAPPNGFRLDESHVYLAGQTAPSPGVTITGDGTAFWLRGGRSNISDIALRYIRFRGLNGVTRNNMIIAKGDRIILDHLTFSWATNYLLAFLRYDSDWSYPISNVTIQRSLFSEAFADHPTAVVLGSDDAMKDRAFVNMTNIDVLKNLFAHNSHRNPMTAADNIVLANNVIYNWSHGAGMMNRRGRADWINNVGVAGPMTRLDFAHMINPYCNELGGDFSIFAQGNLGPHGNDPHADNWEGPSRQIACFRGSAEEPGAPVPAAWRRSEPQNRDALVHPLEILGSETTFDRVWSDVGANARLSCDGRWIPGLDQVDLRVLSEVRTKTGTSVPPQDEAAVGGFSPAATSPPCADTDGDGLPDDWEVRFFGCPTCADPAEVARDGYLVIEHYLNGSEP